MTVETTTILVQRARTGDRYAFAALVERWTAPVHCIALARTIDHQTAEDIVQKTFLTAWRKISGLREPAAFGGWLRQIARSTCRDHARRVARRPPVSALSVVPQPVSNTASPEDHVLTLETRQALHATLLALPEPDRELLLLYHLEGQTTAELAEGLGLSPAAVRQRLSRIRRSLAAGLGAALAVWVSHIHLGSPFQRALKETLAASVAPRVQASVFPKSAVAATAAALATLGVGVFVAAETPDGVQSSAPVAASVSGAPEEFRLFHRTDAPTPPHRVSGLTDAARPSDDSIPYTFADAITDVLADLPDDSPAWRDPRIECTDPVDTCQLWLTLSDPSTAPHFLMGLSTGFQSQGYVLKQFRPLDPEATDDEDELRIGVHMSLRGPDEAPPPEPPPPTGQLVEDLAEVEKFITGWLTHYPGITDAGVDCSERVGICTLRATATRDISEMDLVDLYLDISEQGYTVRGRRLDPEEDTDLPTGTRRHHMALEIRTD